MYTHNNNAASLSNVAATAAACEASERAGGRLMAASHRFRLTRIRTPNTAQHTRYPRRGKKKVARPQAVRCWCADGSLTRRRPYPTERCAHRLQSTNASERTKRRSAAKPDTHSRFPVTSSHAGAYRYAHDAPMLAAGRSSSRPFTNTCASSCSGATARPRRVGGDGGSC